MLLSAGRARRYGLVGGIDVLEVKPGTRPAGLFLAANLETVEVARHADLGEDFAGFLLNLALVITARDVGEIQMTDPGLGGQPARLPRRQMPELCGKLRFDIQVRGFDHQAVGLATDVEQVVGASTIADVDEPSAAARRTQNLLRLDVSTVIQGDASAGDQVPAHRARRHTQRLGFFDEKGAARRLLKGETEASRTSMGDRKGADLESVVFEQAARRDRDQLEPHRGLGAAQDDTHQQIANSLEGEGPSVDLQLIDRFPSHEGRKQAGQSEDVVEVAVGDENALQAAEPEARSKDLSLGALSAVDQEAMILIGDDLRRKATVDGGRRGRRPEKEQFEQGDPEGGAPLYTRFLAVCGPTMRSLNVARRDGHRR